jgi:hypothetical protein
MFVSEVGSAGSLADFLLGKLAATNAKQEMPKPYRFRFTAPQGKEVFFIGKWDCQKSAA